MLTVVNEEPQANQHAAAAVGGSMLDELVRDGARQMLAAALQAEVAAYIEAHADEVDEQGWRLVVRNGYHAPREVATAAGAVPVKQPRVNDKRIDEATGERQRFSPALEQFCRSAAGLSAATITRLTGQWRDDARAFQARSLADVDYVYLWVDGIHLNVRLEADKVCACW